MNQVKRIGCAVLAGLVLCGVLSAAAAPLENNGAIAAQGAEVAEVTIKPDTPKTYEMQVGDEIRLLAEDQAADKEDTTVDADTDNDTDIDNDSETDVDADSDADNTDTAIDSDATDEKQSDEDEDKLEEGSGEDGSVSDHLKWVIDNPSDTEVVKMTDDGTILAAAEGKATVSAACADGSVLSCEITVSGYAVTSIVLSPESKRMKVNETQQITAEILPAKADSELTWVSSNTKVAQVNSDGVVTAKSEGNVIIAAQAENGLAVVCKLTVRGYALQSITLAPSAVTLQSGESTQLEIVPDPSGAQPESVTWRSSDSRIVTVDSNGKITARNAGKVTVTAKTGEGLTASCTVTVTASEQDRIDSITLNHTRLSMTAGKTQKLTATIQPTEKANVETIWSSSNAAVARVTQDGLVTAVRTGQATITVQAGGSTANCIVTVVSAPRTTGNTVQTTTSTFPSSTTANTTGGILYLPGTTISAETLRQYTMPQYIPTAAFLTIDTSFGESTPQIVDVLSEYSIRATFFVSIDDVYASDDQLRQIAGSGHTIGLQLSAEEVRDGETAVKTLDAANERLTVITGTPTRLVRVTGGSTSAVSHDTLVALQAEGYRLWDWNTAANETAQDVDASYQAITTALNATGTVTVQFGDNTNTVSVLQQLLPYIKYCGIPAKTIGASDTPICSVS